MTPWLQKWKELRQSFTYTPQALRLVWQTNRWATVGLGFLTLGGALLPATQAWVGKLIVDGVVASIQGDRAPEQIKTVFVYLILELILFLLGTALNHAGQFAAQKRRRNQGAEDADNDRDTEKPEGDLARARVAQEVDGSPGQFLCVNYHAFFQAGWIFGTGGIIAHACARVYSMRRRPRAKSTNDSMGKIQARNPCPRPGRRAKLETISNDHE